MPSQSSSAKRRSGTRIVYAAGAVLWQQDGTDPVKPELQVAVIHRPRYDDWSLPKGKLDPGETAPVAAVREVFEETGHHSILGRRLVNVSYEIDQGVKKVYYWAARSTGGEFAPGREVDQLIWLPVAAAMKKLEGIVHPMLGASRHKFLQDAEQSGAPVAVIDIPLLFETGGEKRVDAVVVVTTTPELQRERILARPNMTGEKLAAILARQMPDAEKRKRAHFLVDTSHGLDPVRARIKDILAEAVKLAPQRS